jgi:hypothetical protein
MKNIETLNKLIYKCNKIINLSLLKDEVNLHELLKDKLFRENLYQLLQFISGDIKCRVLMELLLSKVIIKNNNFIYDGFKQISYDKSYFIIFLKTNIFSYVKNLDILYVDFSIFIYLIKFDIQNYEYGNYDWVDLVLFHNKINTVSFLNLKKIIIILDKYKLSHNSNSFAINEINDKLDTKELIILLYENFLNFLIYSLDIDKKNTDIISGDKFLKNIINNLDMSNI